MWVNLSLENKMKLALKEQFPGSKWEEYYGNYTIAKQYLVDNIYGEIMIESPALTKHDSSHIQNVIQNAFFLLGEDIEKINGIGLYFLCLCILFHDVGMIKGREGHNDKKKIADIYNAVRKLSPKFNKERTIIIKTCEAHCGISKDGSKDTLKDIERTSSLDGYSLITRDLSAILRLSDELAEGPQRTSQYMNEIHGYPEESTIFHEYANMTDVFIDRGNERIALTFDIDIAKYTEQIKFKEMLEFVYKRIIKLDEERGYNKYYTNFLLPFKKTSARFNFYRDGIPLDFEIDSIELIDDFPIPGNKKYGDQIIQDKFPLYNISNLYSKLKDSSGIS